MHNCDQLWFGNIFGASLLAKSSGPSKTWINTSGYIYYNRYTCGNNRLDFYKVIAHRPGICVHSAELLRQLDSGEEAGVAAANMSQPMDDSAA